MANGAMAGRTFLHELAAYIKWRLEKEGPEPDGHVSAYSRYLEALGVGRRTQLHRALLDHMRGMKDAGSVRKVRDRRG